MLNSKSTFATLALLMLVPLGASAVLAQQPPAHPDDPVQPVPPPVPPKPRPDEDEVPPLESVVEESDAPWGLSAELLDPLFEQAAVYSDYTNRFTCNEVARISDYDASGGASGENVRIYGYLLIKDGFGVREYRQRLAKDGTIKPGEVKDEEPFPPAYAWVFLFSRFNEPFFSYRYHGDRFDGFDWVHEIEFRGSLPFTDGKDIRQWQGTAVVDAVTYTPLEIRAEPAGQQERIEQLYRAYNQSFNIIGFRTKPKPLGYRATIQFRLRKDGLTFPTELRYDTFRAISPNQVVPTKASVRTYEAYQIYRAEVRQEVGETRDEP